MARLQILPLPEGAGDDRPPYLLVIDQLPTGDEKYDALRRDLLDNDITSRTGARAALCFEGTIDLPANDPLPLPEADDVEHAGTTQIVYAHERTRLDLCDALLLSRDTTWRELIEQVGERQRELAGLYRRLDAAAPDDPAARKPALTDALGMDRLRDWDDIVNAARGLRKERDAQSNALERVRSLSEHPDIMDAKHAQPDGYLHGYRVAIRDAKRATRNERATATEDGA